MSDFIKVRSSDAQEFTIHKDLANQSAFLKNLISDMAGSEEVIPLPNVNGVILNKVIEFMEHHKEDPPLPPDYEELIRSNDYISEWDSEFCKVDQGTLFEIIIAANYLDIKVLLDVTCKSVANMIKGKTPEEIRKTFNIENDFSPEEEEQIRRENEWCEDR